MEKRFWLGVGVLAALLAVSIAVTAAMKAIHEPAAAEFQEAAQVALDGDLPAAIAMGRSAGKRWQSTRRFTACVADHGPMDTVEDLLEEMEVFARAGEAEHFAAACARLSAAVKAMSDAHRLTGWNLL